jgi:hypothetical protein
MEIKMKDLDELLNNQQNIQDDDFSVQVMKKVPKASSYKHRQTITMISTILGSLLTFLIVTKSDQSLSFIHEIYNGFINYQAGGIAIFLGITTIFAAIFVHKSQEI